MIYYFILNQSTLASSKTESRQPLLMAGLGFVSSVPTLFLDNDRFSKNNLH